MRNKKEDGKKDIASAWSRSLDLSRVGISTFHGASFVTSTCHFECVKLVRFLPMHSRENMRYLKAFFWHWLLKE